MTHKDTHAVRGIRTTMGSPLFAEQVPEHDDLVVARFRAAGVISTGKNNVPEFAAGSHTFNELFGTTHNPYDRTRSAGGSSGGAAAAIAARIQPLGDGSDMGGSLRNPAAFCNVVGFRPSAGVLPLAPSLDAWAWLGRTRTDRPQRGRRRPGDVRARRPRPPGPAGLPGGARRVPHARRRGPARPRRPAPGRASGSG